MDVDPLCTRALPWSEMLDLSAPGSSGLVDPPQIVGQLGHREPLDTWTQTQDMRANRPTKEGSPPPRWLRKPWGCLTPPPDLSQPARPVGQPLHPQDPGTARSPLPHFRRVGSGHSPSPPFLGSRQMTDPVRPGPCQAPGEGGSHSSPEQSSPLELLGSEMPGRTVSLGALAGQ